MKEIDVFIVAGNARQYDTFLIHLFRTMGEEFKIKRKTKNMFEFNYNSILKRFFNKDKRVYINYVSTDQSLYAGNY